MPKKSDHKILRIGLIRNGKIVEEQLMRSADAVTIGQRLTNNTLVVPASELPDSYELFRPVGGGRYQLCIDSAMSGRISLGDGGVRTVEELIADGTAEETADGYVVALPRRSRGKVKFAGVTILFQFVTPPPPRSEPVLPASMRGGWIKGVEPWVVAMIVVSALLQAGFVGWVQFRDWPEQLGEAGTAVPDRFAEIMGKDKPEDLPEPKDEPEPQEPKDEDQSSDERAQPAEPEPTESKPKEEPKKKEPKTPEERAEQEAERRKRMAERVKKATVLHDIGAVAKEGGSLADTLDEGAGNTSMEDAFEGSTGVETAERDDSHRGVSSSGSSNATGSGSAAGIDDLGQTSGAKRAEQGVKTGSKKEEIVKAKVDIKGGGKPVGTGKLSSGRITSVVRRGAKGIQRCYERVLKKNPDASGKVVIVVTVGQGGRVSSVTAKTSIGGGLGRCVKSRVKGWRFPRPKGGSVTFNKSFVLTGAN